jgi:hypothetical protein
MEAVELAANSVLHSVAFVATTLNLRELFSDIVQCWQQTGEVKLVDALAG